MHNHTRRRRGSSLVCIWLVAISLLNSQFVWALSEATSATQSIQTVSNVRGMLAQLEPLDNALDDGFLSLDDSVFELDFDAVSIAQFVQDSIRFQAYPGLLRSARGTLISRSGNALDQGVLLARLLKDAGFEARIAVGELQLDDANRLLGQMTGPGNWSASWSPSSRGRVEEWLNERASGLPDADSVRSEMTGIAEEATALATQVHEAFEGIGSSDEHVHDRLVQESRDYFWVEYRLGPGDAWIEAHPAFGDAVAPSVEAMSYLADNVPADLQHRVRIAVKLEKRLGGALEEVDLMSAWERPAANAAYLPQTIAVLPYNGRAADSNQYLQTAASDAELFVVTWNDSIAPGAQVFTLQGDTLPLDALNPAGEFIKQVSDRAAMAVDALSGIGLSAEEDAERGPAKRLERLWIEYTLIAPDGSERETRRYLLDTDDEGNRLVHQQMVADSGWLNEARAAMLQSRTLLVGTGPVNPTWLTRKLVTTAKEGRSTLIELERRASDSDPSIGPSVLNGLDPLPDTRWIKYLFATHSSTGFGQDQAAYLHQPTLVSFNHGVRESGDGLRGYEQVDILFNARRVVELEAGRWASRPETAALAGVLETRAEQRQMEARGGAPGASAYRSLSQASGRLKAVRPDRPSDLEALDLSPGAMLAAQRELNSGYVLVVPSSGVVNHWWRVDPSTGTATGMAIGAGGYGGATAAEYIIYTGIIIGTLLMYYSFYSCFTSESGLALFCCLVDSWLTGIIVAALAFTAGMLIGTGLGAVGAALGTATAEVELVAAIVNFVFIDGASTAISFTDFRIRACGSLTGT